MKAKNFSRSFFLSICFLLTAHIGASQAKTDAPAHALTPTVDAANREGLIHLDVTVTSQNDDPVAGLAAQDFKLLDNGSPSGIRSFHSSMQAINSQGRLSEIILVLDQINVTSEQFASVVMTSTIGFLKQNGGYLETPVSIYYLSTSGLYATTAPSHDGNALAAEVEHMHFPRIIWSHRQGTVQARAPGELRSDLAIDCMQTLFLIAIEHRDLPGRKLVAWMGWGWPIEAERKSSSQNEFEAITEFSTRLREARIVVDEVVVPEKASDMLDPDQTQMRDKQHLAGIRAAQDLNQGIYKDYPFTPLALPILSAQSGGRLIDRAFDLVAALNQCVNIESTFYSVSFDPPVANHPDEFHALTWQAMGTGFSLHTNTGYYDQPMFYDQHPTSVEPVSVHELLQILEASHGKKGAQLVAQLNGLQLTERMSSDLLSTWKDRLKGNDVKAALVQLADASAFLNPPANEIPSAPAPDSDEQRRILSRVRSYAGQVASSLPDFFSKRTKTDFMESTSKAAGSWKTAPPERSLRVAFTENATITYRDGHEVVKIDKISDREQEKTTNLNFLGIFGPILKAVVTDATNTGGTLTWSHWEKNGQGRVAVFDFTVRGPSPSYSVQRCCLRDGKMFLVQPDYHGSLSIDEETGVIFRLTIESEPGWVVQQDLEPVQYMNASKMTVEYGPVDIGGRKYVCPLRSVVMDRGRSIQNTVAWNQGFSLYGPFETMLDDITYSDYHKFGSEARIVDPGQPQ